MTTMPRGELRDGQVPLEKDQLNQEWRRQYSTSLPQHTRFFVDTIAETYVDMHQLALDRLDLTQPGTILEVGCGDGSQLIAAYERMSKIGRDIVEKSRFYGLDLNPIEDKDRVEESSFEIGRFLAKVSGAKIHFIQGDAAEIPLPHQSVDSALALFMLYHLEDTVESGISELQRVLKPGGKVLIATSGERCKYRTHEAEAMILEYLGKKHGGAKHGGSLTRSFTAERARLLLPGYFNNVQELPDGPHQSPIRIGPLDDIENRRKLVIYRDGLATYADTHHIVRDGKAYRILPGEWSEAFNEVVLPLIVREIRTKGYFEDLIDRSVFECSNDELSDAA